MYVHVRVYIHVHINVYRLYEIDMYVCIHMHIIQDYVQYLMTNKLKPAPR